MANSTQIIIASLVSFAVGWFGHRLSSRRDRENREYDASKGKMARKHAFLKFMAQWRYEVAHSSPETTLISEFRAKLHLFRAESATIDDDFTFDRWRQFAFLCMALYAVEEELERDYTQNTRQVMGEAIDSVIRFVENTQG